MSFLKRLLGRDDYEEKLLEALVEKGLITLERAQELLLDVRNTGRRAAELVVESGAVPEGVLMAFLARSLRTAPLDITKFPMRKNIALLVTVETAIAGRLLPMEKIGSSLTVAMSNPLDRRAVIKVEKETGLRVKVVVTGPTMLIARLKEAYTGAEELLQSERPAQKATKPPPAAPIREPHPHVRVIAPGTKEADRETPKKEPTQKLPRPLKTPVEPPAPKAKAAPTAPAATRPATEAAPKPAAPAVREPEAAVEPVPEEEVALSLEDHLEEIIAGIKKPHAELLSELAAPVILAFSRSNPSAGQRRRRK